MRRFQKLLYGLHPYLLSSIASVLTIAQIVLAFLLHGQGSEALQWAGWICLWTAGLFGVLPIITLRQKGGVPKGKSYVHTTVLVDSDIYTIVRHPQGGVAGLLINLGVILITRHWLVLQRKVSPKQRVAATSSFDVRHRRHDCAFDNTEPTATRLQRQTPAWAIRSAVRAVLDKPSGQVLAL
jgi:hypothetical protein